MSDNMPYQNNFLELMTKIRVESIFKKIIPKKSTEKYENAFEVIVL